MKFSGLVKVSLLVLVLLVHFNESAAKEVRVTWNNIYYAMARHHIRDNLEYFTVRGTDQCTTEDHDQAFDTFVRVIPAKDEVNLLGQIQHGILMNMDNVFFSKNELMLVMKTNYVKFIILSRQHPVSVDVYRNPYTGRRHIVFRDNLERRPMNLTGDTMYNSFYYHSCEPLPSFLRRRYSKLLPARIAYTQTLHDRNFLTYFGSIGGILKESILLANLKHQRPVTEPVSNKLNVLITLSSNATDMDVAVPMDLQRPHKN